MTLALTAVSGFVALLALSALVACRLRSGPEAVGYMSAEQLTRFRRGAAIAPPVYPDPLSVEERGLVVKVRIVPVEALVPASESAAPAPAPSPALVPGLAPALAARAAKSAGARRSPGSGAASGGRRAAPRPAPRSRAKLR